MTGRSPVLVDDQDPRDAAGRLLDALAAGRVPVVVGPGWPGGAAAALLAAAGALPPDHGVLVVLTSGSTAAPRAVCRRWESWRCSFGPFDRLTGLTADDVLWVPGTAASTLTLFAVLHALESGPGGLRTGGAWRGPPSEPAGPAAPAEVPELAEVTAVHAVPPVAAQVLAAAERGLLPRLAVLVTAGAQVPVALRRTADRLGVRLVEYYGAAELSFVAADADGTGLQPFPGVELQVRPVPDPAEGGPALGEVWARSPYLSDGYLPVDGVPDGPLRRDPDGWASVGDRAGTVRAADGRDRLLLAGRPGSTASVGATTVLLDDVEAVLREVPGVADVVCAAEPAGRLGERVVAVVQPLPGVDPRPLLRAAATRSLPPAARPVRWLLEPQLPSTPGGKVDRHEVRARIRQAAAEA